MLKCMYVRSVCLCMALNDYIQSGYRTKNDRGYRISKFVHGSYYWWWYFQLGDRNRNDRAYRILNLCMVCASITCKTSFFFISRTHDKAKRTIKKNQYEPNSKENPVWNKWKSRILIMCNHMGSNIWNKVTDNEWH